MPDWTVSRRKVALMLGGGAVFAPSIARALSARSELSMSAEAPAPAPTVDSRSLLAPLRVGSTLRGWTIAEISALSEGVVTVTLENEAAHRLYLEILARDTSPLASKPPVQTSRLAVHVCNAGDGWMPTVEEQGLTAMALGAILKANEGSAHLEGFLTHAQRLAKYGDTLITPPSSG